MKKTVFLTGATGFLGSHLFKRLLEEKEYFVIGAKRQTSNLERLNLFLQGESEDRYILTDVDDYGRIEKDIFQKYKIDVIIHTATEYGRSTGCQPTDILKSNLIFPLTLLEIGMKHGLELFINTDSYFNKPNQTYRTLLDYSLSKKSLNIWLEYYAQRVKVVNLRLEHLYGDYDGRSKFCENIIRKIAVERTPEMDLTNGEQKRDFVHVDDVCAAYLATLENYRSFHFNYLLCEVGTGEVTSIREFADYVKEYSGSGTRLNYGALPYRDDEIMISRADTSFLKNWDFEAKTSYRDGIRKIIDIYMGRQ